MNNYIPNDYQNFIALSRYARWKDDEQRRENWGETVDRYFNYVVDYVQKKQDIKKLDIDVDTIKQSVLGLGVMPSMRAMMTSGPALDRCHVGAYNCSYVPVDSPRSFDEAMYILMCGTGVGFSVERESVLKLPVVSFKSDASGSVDGQNIVVEDSKIGWCKALKELIALLYRGYVPKWDTSKVRPAGARLKTFGGRASGPEPLEDLFNFCVEKFDKAQGRRLHSVEAHDIMCKIGEIVVVGGVRRSALISLSNLSDPSMQKAKSGDWWTREPQRGLANNSVSYKEKPDMSVFFQEWHSLYESKSGERGIFNREAARKQASKNGRRNTDKDIAWGTNPCSEIILRPYQFCNLSEVVVRATDSLEDLKEKVRQATILGTLQSCLTDFKYLRSIWKKNTEEERLLGVSLTGIMDHQVLNGFEGLEKTEAWLKELKEVAVAVNAELAYELGVPQSAAITCVKPSGTVSQLVDSASGIHARHNPHYVRTVRGDIKDPMTKFMIDSGIPSEPCFMKPESTVVFSFPMKAPDNAVCRNDLTAIEQLELWSVYQDHWCEHKPSVTVSVKENEWLKVGDWVYENFDKISGISFLPHSDHSYQQAPYQDCTEAEYAALKEAMPPALDWTKLQDYEREDNTSGSQELACTAGVCEVVDIASR